MKRLVKGFLADESAASAIQYGLIITFIALGIISAVQGLGSRLGEIFSAIRDALN